MQKAAKSRSVRTQPGLGRDLRALVLKILPDLHNCERGESYSSATFVAPSALHHCLQAFQCFPTAVGASETSGTAVTKMFFCGH